MRNLVVIFGLIAILNASAQDLGWDLVNKTDTQVWAGTGPQPSFSRTNLIVDSKSSLPGWEISPGPSETVNVCWYAAGVCASAIVSGPIGSTPNQPGTITVTGTCALDPVNVGPNPICTQDTIPTVEFNDPASN